MNKLIYANFSRLWKSKIFWIGLILTDLLAVWILADRIHFKMISGYQLSSDDMIFSGTVTLPFVAAVVISIFIGTEYSDGTIRNKLITGHSRHSIYFANLITSTAAVFIIYTSYLLIIVCAGIPLVGNFAAPIKILLANFIINFVALASLSAILLLLCMLIPSKAIAAVSSLILVLIIFFSTMTSVQILEAPEYYEGYTWLDEESGMIEQDEEPHKNPSYLPEGSLKRKILETWIDISPLGQVYQYGNIESQTSVPKDLPKPLLYSFGIIAVTLIFGIIQFRQQNLK